MPSGCGPGWPGSAGAAAVTVALHPPGESSSPSAEGSDPQHRAEHSEDRDQSDDGQRAAVWERPAVVVGAVPVGDQ